MQFSDVDYRDIQGLVRFGHGHLPEARFLLVEIADDTKARAWIRSAAERVTQAYAGDKPRRALQIAFTCEGLVKLRVPREVIEGFSLEFRAGMADRNRARRLGDVDANAPEKWIWGAPGKLCPHLLVMIYAEQGKLDAWEHEAKGDLWCGAFGRVHSLTTIRRDDLEPFGFVDGVSQPRIDWRRSRSTRLRDTVEYTNMSALGEFLLGYPNEYGRYTDRPLIDAHDERAKVLPLAEDEPGMRDLGRNGTYLVLRDLGQDVAGFKSFVGANANSAWTKRTLETAMSGRVPADIPLIPPLPPNKPPRPAGEAPWDAGKPPWGAPYAVDDPKQIIPAGGPVTPLRDEALEGVGPKLKDIWLDQFTFKADPDGTTCPLGAHIRRANPRNADLPEGTSGWLGKLMRTLGFARVHTHDDLLSSTRFHRVLRRGRAYRDADDPQGAARSGLRFICLNASIARQFEFIQTSWLASAKFNGLDEDDPLLGARTTLFSGAKVDAFTRPRDDGLSCRLHGLPRFVTVHGGAYFFLPGLAALRYIASD